MKLSPPGTHFTAESTAAIQIKYLAQGHGILMPWFEPSTSVSRNRHSDHKTNMLRYKEAAFVYSTARVVRRVSVLNLNLYSNFYGRLCIDRRHILTDVNDNDRAMF